MFLLSVLILMSACTNAKDQELSDYVDKMKEDLEGESEVDTHIAAFENLILDAKPEEALELLQDEIIPRYEELVEENEGLELAGKDALETNAIVTRLLQADLDTQLILRETFTEILEKLPADRVEEIEIDAKLEALSEINEELVVLEKEYQDQLVYLIDTYDYLEAEEDLEDTSTDSDLAQLDQDTELLIATFTEVVAANHFLAEGEEGETEEETDEVATVSDNDFVFANEEILREQGNPSVAFDGTVTIEDNLFQVAGLSNLLEGSTVYFDAYHYGSDNPYLKDELVVGEDGSFELTAELAPDQLNGEPLTLRLSYQPDKEEQEAQEIYGAEGEHIEGPFKHKFTNIKRTRHGAFTYAQIEFKNGVEQGFHMVAWDEADDYGDLDIWMEKDLVDTKETYYDITMNSNLTELTWIKARVEIPGYESAGMTSRANVRPDGSFRFQIPRPDVDSEEVIVVIEATSDGAIATEELYGEHGENFAGELTAKTKRGQKIVYELLLGENR